MDVIAEISIIPLGVGLSLSKQGQTSSVKKQ